MNFEIDERASLGSILKAIRAGNKAEHVAKAIDGISQKPFLKALRDAGYEYSQKTPKGWRYVGGGDEPLNKSIFDFVTKVKRNSPEVHPITHKGELVAKSVSPEVHPQFTHDEQQMILEMLKEWRASKENQNVLEAKPSIFERIKTIPQGDKVRKTIVIDKAIGERLDEYCEKERINKSDVLYLALAAFLNEHY